MAPFPTYTPRMSMPGFSRIKDIAVQQHSGNTKFLSDRDAHIRLEKADILKDLGCLPEAATQYRSILKTYERVCGDGRELLCGHAYEGLGDILSRQGYCKRARVCFEIALVNLEMYYTNETGRNSAYVLQHHSPTELFLHAQRVKGILFIHRTRIYGKSHVAGKNNGIASG